MAKDEVKLINPRGRAVYVPRHDVRELLKRDFVYPPKDQPDMYYSPVHDKGEDYEEPYLPKTKKIKRKVLSVTDVIRPEEV